MKKYIINILIMFPLLVMSQEKIEGMVMEANPNKKHLPLVGANVYWLGTQAGIVTNEKGLFAIPYKSEYKKLVISYLGFKTDTLNIDKPQRVHHLLQRLEGNELDEVVVEKKRDAILKSQFQAQNVITVNSAELLKAACCNLSESFETNPSIDVNFSDAVTGTKQIQMLGLTSPYILITQENIPSVRGASQAYGLSFTPGTWVESIQITKGTGTVANGFESISGQINAELVKPFSDDKLFVNGYVNANGRYELNTHFNKELNDKWHTGLYLHGNTRTNKVDENDDGFLDVPTGEQLNLMNRWQYTNAEKGWVSFINVRLMNDKKQLGQAQFSPGTDKFSTEVWGSEIDTRRFDTSAKIGYVFPDLPYQSFGFQTAYSNHNQNSYFGLNQYDIKQESVYTNLIFNSIIGSTQHKFKTGLNFSHDGYKEMVNGIDVGRVENAIGGFFEYSYNDLEKISIQAGLRLDHHNLIGTFLTPRLHIRYTPWEKGTLRASVGTGKRNANIFAENQQLFASSRTINIENGLLSGSLDGAYGLEAETAWNYGVSYLQKFNLFTRPAEITFDFYLTNFENQVVVDWENPREISFYNLEGKSYASSFQFEFNLEPVENLNVRTAYKFYDVKTDYASGRLQKPLQAQHRLFANVGYETVKKENGSQWRFDYTLHWLGKQRLPNTSRNFPEDTLDDFSPAYSLMNAQLTKVFSNRFEVYVGGENINNYTQSRPILSSENPFGLNFDTTIVWAPVIGGMYYTGFRFRL